MSARRSAGCTGTRFGLLLRGRMFSSEALDVRLKIGRSH